MISWPDTLPAIRWSGFGYQPGKQVQKFQVDDGGPAEQGRFTTATTVKCGFVLRCTQDQQNALLEFYTGDAQCGAQWFDFENPVTGKDCVARFDGDNPPASAGASRNKFDMQIQLELKL